MKASSEIRMDAIDRTLHQLRSLGAQSKPIVCGPWVSEIGFELLYWIPFLRWAMEVAGLNPDQLVILSRGGCASWYSDLAAHYVELYDAFTPAELKALNARRVIDQRPHVQRIVTSKQHVIGPVDREILSRVGLAKAALLHPSMMYTLFRLYWRRRVLDLYDRCARLKPMTVPEAVITKPYVAVKFYSSQACQQTMETRAHVAKIVRRIAKFSRVVVLDSGDGYDEHGSFPIADDPNVIRVPLTPRTNLAEQTSVIGNAEAFVGTYGGFAYLAPLLGVPTTAFYATRNFREDHLRLATQRFQRLRVKFDVLDLSAERDVRWADAS